MTLSQDELLQWQRVFDQVDVDGNGSIDQHEFAKFLKIVSSGLSQSEIATGFQYIDSDGNGLIDFEELIAWWEEHRND